MTNFAARRTIMVDTQVRPSDVTKFPIIEAMLAVPREAFVPAEKREAAYMGENLSIGPRRVMLEPRTLAKMLDALNIQPSERVLDVGAGLGYSSAVIAHLAGSVVALEESAELAGAAELGLAAYAVQNLALVRGPLAAGAPDHGPYDVILLQGAAEEVPACLLEQMTEGGRIGAVFMEGALGSCRIGYWRDGRVSWRFAFNAGAPVLPGFEKRHTFTL